MDRLISEQKAIEAINDYWGEMETPTIDGYINAIKAIPSAEPYKGMTNGEVIKTVFPNADIEYHKISVYMMISPLTNLVIFDKDWWNSPYQKGSKERDYDVEYRNHSEMILNAQKVRDKE